MAKIIIEIADVPGATVWSMTGGFGEMSKPMTEAERVALNLRAQDRLVTPTDGLVARLARKYGPQRPASRVPLRLREVVWGCCIGIASGWVAVEALIWIAGLVP